MSQDFLTLEAHLGTEFRHPNIVRSHNYGEIDGTFFIEMDAIEAKKVAAEGPEKAPVATSTPIKQIVP